MARKYRENFDILWKVWNSIIWFEKNSLRSCLNTRKTS